MASSIWSLYIRHFLAYANSAVHSVVVRGPFFENVVVTRSDCLVDFLLVAKYHEFFGFNYLNDLYAFDNMAASRRFTIVYRISNPALKTSLLVTTSASEGVPVATAQNVYAAAAWPEREA
jgi:NADH:ubiquinone oxidoreductase subunit C